MQQGEAVDGPDITVLDAVSNAVSLLSDREQECVQGIFYERLSYEQLALKLGVSKPYAWRITQRAMEKLRTHLSINPNILRKVPVFNNWQDAADTLLRMYDRTHGRAAVLRTIDACADKLVYHIRNHKEPPSMLYSAIALEAVAQMKHDNTWDRDTMLAHLVGKQRDYGHENIASFGLVGIAVRMCDKVARLRNLLASGAEPVNESLLDTWVDLVGYGLIAEMWINGTFMLDLPADQPTDIEEAHR